MWFKEKLLPWGMLSRHINLHLWLGIVEAWTSDTQDINGLVSCFTDPETALRPDKVCNSCPLPSRNYKRNGIQALVPNKQS